MCWTPACAHACGTGGDAAAPRRYRSKPALHRIPSTVANIEISKSAQRREPDLHLRSTAVRPRVVRNHLETRMVGLARTVIRRHVQRGVGSVIRCAQRGNTHRLQSFEDPSACSACNVFTCGIADPVIPQRCTVIAALRTVDHRASQCSHAYTSRSCRVRAPQPCDPRPPRKRIRHAPASRR